MARELLSKKKNFRRSVRKIMTTQQKEVLKKIFKLKEAIEWLEIQGAYYSRHYSLKELKIIDSIAEILRQDKKYRQKYFPEEASQDYYDEFWERR